MCGVIIFLLRICIPPETVYRINHYVGKEVILNISTLRWANQVRSLICQHSSWVALPRAKPRGHAPCGSSSSQHGTESISSRCRLSSRRISVWAGVAVRRHQNPAVLLRDWNPSPSVSGYFDPFGIIRDMMQNQLLQVILWTAMEPPEDMSAASIIEAKVELLRCIETLSLNSKECFLGQFGPSATEPGYLDDETVPKDSRCNTFASLLLQVNNTRWRGVPFLMTAGKGLDERLCEVWLTRSCGSLRSEVAADGRFATSQHASARHRCASGTSRSPTTSSSLRSAAATG